MPSSALQVARTGLEAQDARMRVIANNLANVGTTGFKRDRANFSTLAYQDARVAGQQSSNETAYAIGLNLGTGVGIQSTTRIETQGSLNTTGNPLDMALDGPGYFQVQLPGGQIGYTRAGNFTRSSDGQLVTAQGYPVLPAITIPDGSTAISVAADGTVSAAVAGNATPQQLGQITIANFINAAGLKATGHNLFVSTPASGEPSALVMLTAAQGYFDALTLSAKFCGPKSNSWLPGTARSKGTMLVRSMVFWPLSNDDISEGDSMSPSNR